MVYDLPERDWKILRNLKQVALERFCERILQEVNSHIEETESTWHERYLAVFKVIDERDNEMAVAFNNFRRSSAILQSASMYHLRLIHPDELKGLTPEIEKKIRDIAAFDGGA